MNTKAAPGTRIWALVLSGVVVAAGSFGWLATRRQTTDLDGLRKEVLALQKAQQGGSTVVREIRTVVQEAKAVREPEQPVPPDGNQAPAREDALSPEEAQYRGGVIVAAQEKVLA